LKVEENKVNYGLDHNDATFRFQHSSFNIQHFPVTDLKTLSIDELKAFCDELGMERYRSEQLFEWMYRKGVNRFEEMTNLPLGIRRRLSEVATMRGAVVSARQVAADRTTKFLFRLHDGKQVEAVLIPEFFTDGVANRLTVCVSSQVGCLFGCTFCATGKMGWLRNLTRGEIADQVVQINRECEEEYGKRITNVVYMGMGEPLHNYDEVMASIDILTQPKSVWLSPRRITVSTVGLANRIKRMADEKKPFNLAISLHAATDLKRDQIMPVNESMDLDSLLEALKYYYRWTKLPVTYEYLLFHKYNDGAEDVKALVSIARWVPSKVNVIVYNNVEGVELKRASEDRLNAFIWGLTKAGIRATVRRSRGDDIDAGCGQLAIRQGQPMGKTIKRTVSVDQVEDPSKSG
jgi:23S rRNA (adenine2503-C2)-methyltransferase